MRQVNTNRLYNTNKYRQDSTVNETTCNSNIWGSSFSEENSDLDVSGISLYQESYSTTSISIIDGLSDFSQGSVKQDVTKEFNKACNESNIIGHLCNCNNNDFDWCFIHQKVKAIDLNPKQTQFGFVPLNIIEVPLFMPTVSLNIEQLDQWAFRAHQLVKASGTYNYKACRIKVPTELNIKNWRALCSNYHDQKLLDYLEYGFPLCINREQFQFNTECVNHPSAVNFPSDVDTYFKKETKHKAIVGPCDNIPFPVHYSPLLSRPKEGDTRRIIVNMSFPYGASVNDNINNNEYDGVDFDLRYPTVDDIVKSVQELGNEVLLSKIDVSRAFRNLRVDPFEYDALGLSWGGKSYIDISIPMGMKTGSALCQRTTDVIRHVMQSRNVRVYNYIDDVICVHQRRDARQEFDALYSLFEFLGLPINPKKVVPPSTALTCMGINVDVASGVISIPQEKCLQILDACRLYITKKYITRKQLQSLLGKLLYLHRCVPASRSFVNRLLNTLRTSTYKVIITEEMKKDLSWFIQFLVRFNGKLLFPDKRQEIDVYVDASLSGLGAYWNNNVYAVSRPILSTAGFNITHLEMMNVMLSLRVFAHAWEGKKIRFHIDNQAVVYSLKFGKVKDNILQSIARTIWLLAASHDIQLQYSHIPGILNKEADALSRVFEQPSDYCMLLLHNCVCWPVNGGWCQPNMFL